MSTDLRDLLTATADDLVPERFPLESRVPGVRRLVRRRRAVARVQAGAGALVAVAAIGTVATLVTGPPTTPIATPPAACGQSWTEIVPDAGPLDGVAMLQTADGPTAGIRTQLENLTDVPVTTAPEVVVIVSLPGTGAVVGYQTVTTDAVQVGAGTSGDVMVTVDLLACGHTFPAGQPLPDGTYDLRVIGTATTATDGEIAWTASSGDLLVIADGTPSVVVDGATGAADAFDPMCGEMIPAVEENAFWASVTAADGAGPYIPVDPAFPDHGGMRLDVRVGTIGDAVTGDLGSEVVTVLTDLDGVVVTWWSSLEDASAEPAVVPLALDAGDSQVAPDAAWFPGVNSCAAGASLVDGDYRIFVWLEVATPDGSHPVLSAPLDVSVAFGEMTASA